MNFLVLFLMSYILASTESVKNGLTEKLRADVWEKYEGKQYLPRSIEETDVMIKNLLELLDNMTVQIENMHVNVDLVPNSRVVITFSTISIVYNVISLLVTVYNSQSNSEELTHIEKGFRLIDARLAAFESRLDRLIDELRLIQLQIQLAPYHSIRIEIHLLLDELHATLQQPSAEAVNRFVIKV